MFQYLLSLLKRKNRIVIAGMKYTSANSGDNADLPLAIRLMNPKDPSSLLRPSATLPNESSCSRDCLISLEYASSDWLIQSGEGNIDLLTTQDGDSCEGDFNQAAFDEGINIAWDYAALDEQKPLFIPYRWTFEYPLPKADFDTIVADKRNSIQVETFGGVLKEMFIWSLKYIATEPLAQFECIEANV